MRRTSGKAILDISLVRLILNGHNPRSIAMTNRIAHKPGEFSHGLTNQFITSIARQGCSPRLMQKLVENTESLSNLVMFAELGCPGFEFSCDGSVILKTSQMEFAGAILDDDFISPSEVMELIGYEYSQTQLEHLAKTLPVIENLWWLKANDYMLMPGPVSDWTLSSIYQHPRLNKLFYVHNDNGHWFMDEKCSFTYTDTVRKAEWLMIRKTAFPNSGSKKWGEQEELIIPPERIPNIAEVIYAQTLSYKVREWKIEFGPRDLRTSSTFENGRHICAIHLQGEGLALVKVRDTDCGVNIGIASAR